MFQIEVQALGTFIILKRKSHLNDLGVFYTHSLAPADFSGAVFTCVFFQKMLFLLYKLRNVFLVTNDLSAADLVHADFCQT